MKIAISGPMSGLPDDNIPAFMEAEARLRQAGHDVFNPVTLASERDKILSTSMGAKFRETSQYHQLVEACIFAIQLDCQGLCQLDGWRDSYGACKEFEAAKAAGLEIGDLDHWAPGIKWIGDPAFEPRQGYEGDAGYDLIVAETTRIDYRGWADVPMGISVELPRGFWAMLVGRSSTIRKRQLVINTAIIDNGYRGPLFAATSNFGPRIAIVERGERIAQLIPMPLSSVGLSLHRVAGLSDSERGTKAFGSTGS